MIWRIGEILIQKKLISWDQLQIALEEQKKTKEFTGEILVQKGFVSRSLLYKALAEQHGIRFVNLRRTHINPLAVEMIPQSIAQKYHIMPIELLKDVLIIGISNPLNIWPQNEIKQLVDAKEIQSVLCLPQDIELAIKENYGAEAVRQR